MALSKKQIKEYIKSKGVCCPYCKSLDIEGGSFDMEAGEVLQSIRCLECHETWDDVYKLVNVYSA